MQHLVPEQQNQQKSSSPGVASEESAEDDEAGSSDVLIIFLGLMFLAFCKILFGHFFWAQPVSNVTSV